jgi:hypothetical protein
MKKSPLKVSGLAGCTLVTEILPSNFKHFHHTKNKEKCHTAT